MLERELAELLEGTEDAAFAVDLQGIVRTWNQAAEKLLGYTALQAIGKPCHTMINGRRGGILMCRETCDLLACVQERRKIPNFDMETSTRSGQPMWVNVSLLVARNERTGQHLAIHCLRDISERKKIEHITSEIMRMARSLVGSLDEQGAFPPISPLTAQEHNVLRLLASGKTPKEVKAELHVSMQTLRNHIYHINQKLHTKSRTEAIIQALKRGLV